MPVSRELRLPAIYAHVPDYLAQHDADLRIRRSVELPGTFVLERRCRRRPAVRVGLLNNSDIHVQGRDGYIHVARVHRAWLERPWNIVRALRDDGEDLWVKGAAKFTNERDYEAAWQKETNKRRRKSLFRAAAREMFDRLDRQGNADGTERTRISNAGIPAKPSRQQRRQEARKAEKRARRMRRKSLFRAAAREMFDRLDRQGNADGTERTRISNAGIPAKPSRQQRRQEARKAEKRARRMRRWQERPRIVH